MARVLVIDDDRLLRGTVELLLKSEGHRVASARGPEGIQRFRSGRFDLVACDISMPHMGGAETIRQIRGLSASLPIIAFTATGGATPEIGATETLAKPFDGQDLLVLVRRCLGADRAMTIDPGRRSAASVGSVFA
jgi:CheY-like chemotaxis protein